MNELIGYKLESLPAKGLKKIYDLLEFDGPILSHYKDHKETNYLFYWVDYDETYNRWLFWKISEDQLYAYLKGAKSLRELLVENNRELVFSVDIDKDVNFLNINAVELDELPTEYCIEDDSYYRLPIPSIYNEWITGLEANGYLISMRERALYFKLVPSTVDYSTTITAADAGIFLKKISLSFLNFVEEDFFYNFKTQITDFSRIKKVISQFKEILSPRIVQLEYGSFKVGISSDIHHTVEVNTFTDWQRSILEKYKSEVVDIDYTDKESLDKISKKYSEESRKKIFSPFIDILNDKDYKVEVSNYTNTYKRKYKRVPKDKEQIIIPKRDYDEVEDEKRKLYSVIIEAIEGMDVMKISKKGLQSGLLFSQEIENVPMTLDQISHEGIVLSLNYPFQYTFRIENNSYVAESKDYGIHVKSDNKERLTELLQKSFVTNYLLSTRKSDTTLEQIDMLYADIVKAATGLE
jgi:hypothetical protein